MSPLRKFRDLADNNWLNTLIKSISQNEIQGVKFPDFPEDQLQINTVGSSGEHALREASFFYKEIKGFAKANGVELNDKSRVCDFGCGWGRHYRFFLKDLNPENLVGTDIDESFLNVCKQTIPFGTFYQNSVHPPMDFPDNHFDMAYAFSVFSHLNKDIGIEWIQEFSRILKPGGLIIVTTHSRGFIDFCESIRGKTHDSKWLQSLANVAFLDSNKAREDYEKGEFLYASTGGGGPRTPDFYGEAVLSPTYVRNNWTENLELVEFIDNPSRLSQAMIVLKKL